MVSAKHGVAAASGASPLGGASSNARQAACVDAARVDDAFSRRRAGPRDGGARRPTQVTCIPVIQVDGKPVGAAPGRRRMDSPSWCSLGSLMGVLSTRLGVTDERGSSGLTRVRTVEVDRS